MAKSIDGALALSSVTARHLVSRRTVVLTTLADIGPEGEFYIPPQEIYINVDELYQLTLWVKEKEDGKET